MRDVEESSESYHSACLLGPKHISEAQLLLGSAKPGARRPVRRRGDARYGTGAIDSLAERRKHGGRLSDVNSYESPAKPLLYVARKVLAPLHTGPRERCLFPWFV